MRLRKLANPWWDNGVDKANAQARDDARANKHVGVDAASHEGGADDS